MSVLTEASESVSELFPRVSALVRARRTEFAESTMKIPMGNYRDPEVLQAELKHVLGASPLVLAPSAALHGEGAYLTRQLPDGRSVIVSRGEDGVARVLVNTCRHRGARVAEGSGCARRFTCAYHGWSYDSTGALAGQPGRPGFDDVQASDLGLAELPSEESFGFVWLVPAGSPGVTAHLGSFAEPLASYDYASFQANPAMEVELSANWKCLLEAFFETYHFPFVHSTSMVGKGSIANIVSYDAFGAHARLGVPGVQMQGLPDDASPADIHMSVLYYVYPNLIIANTVLGCELIEARPAGSPGRSVLRHTFLSKVDPELVAAHTNEEYLQAIRAVIRDEDGPAITSSGGGISDAAHDFALLGRNEPGCQHIHRQIRSALA